MAVLPPHNPFSVTGNFDSFSIKTKDHPIGGKLIHAQLRLSIMDQMQFIDDGEYKLAIKRKLASELAQFMLENNLVEFTQLPQHSTGENIIHARCFLTPNDQVKILRINYANSK
jgi:hypothetical protein